MGLTTVSVVGRSATFEPVALPDLQHDPEVHGSAAKFVQTAGGRAPLPAPRTVKHPPFFQLKPPDVWTTLELTIHADGTSTFEVAGASKFPRHWVYDSTGALGGEGRAGRLRATGTARSSGSTPRGVARTHARTSPPSRRRSSASCRRTIMRGGTEPEIRTVKKNRRARASRATRATSCTCCSTACSTSSSTASRSPRSAPARSSASARCSKAVVAPRRCRRGRSAGSRSRRRRDRPRRAHRAERGSPPRGSP